MEVFGSKNELKLICNAVKDPSCQQFTMQMCGGCITVEGILGPLMKVNLLLIRNHYVGCLMTVFKTLYISCTLIVMKCFANDNTSCNDCLIISL